MAIYRGPGGAGDAVADTSNQSESAVASAAAAATSAANAATSATNSANSATSSSNSATAAASSASAASSSASSASSSASSASSSASAASSSATAAQTAQTAAEAAQTAAETAETNAQAYELSANNWATKTDGPVAGGEYSAKYHAQQSASSASAASSSASSAASSASAASASADAALAALDSFDDRYLGQKASDPSLDNDGNALITGALYFNTTSGIMKVYDGSAWLAAYVSGSGGSLLAANNLSDLTNVADARTNLGLGTAATTASTDYATAAQGTLADSATQPGDNVSTLTNDAGYITSYAETDPVYTASSWYTTTNNATNWNTAYGWGNHASAGYLTSYTETDTLNSVTGRGSSTANSITVGGLSSTGNIILNNATYLQSKDSGGTARDIIAIDGFNGLNINSSGGGSAAPIVFKENGTEIARFDTSGRLGIGTSSPTNTLHVYGGSNTQFKVQSSGAEANITIAGTSYGQVNNSVGDLYITNDTASNIILRTSSTERVRVGPSGQIGIGGANYGSSGQVLTSQGSGSAPVWASPSGGKVLQVLSATKFDTQTSTSNTLADVTGLSVTITPSSTSSKILILATVNGSARNGWNVMGISLVRGGSQIYIGNAAGSRSRDSIFTSPGHNNQVIQSGSINYLDSPATTSATTYKIQFRVDGSNPSSGVHINRTYDDPDSTDHGRVPSTITVMEIAA